MSLISIKKYTNTYILTIGVSILLVYCRKKKKAVVAALRKFSIIQLLPVEYSILLLSAEMRFFFK